MPGLNTIATWDGAEWLVAWLDLAARGALLLGTAAVLNLALRRASAATRHLVWSVAVLALVLLPVFVWTVPTWEAPLPQRARALLSQLPSFERPAHATSEALVPVSTVDARPEGDARSTKRAAHHAVATAHDRTSTPTSHTFMHEHATSHASHSVVPEHEHSHEASDRAMSHREGQASHASVSLSVSAPTSVTARQATTSPSVPPTSNASMSLAVNAIAGDGDRLETARLAQNADAPREEAAHRGAPQAEASPRPALWFAWLLPIWGVGALLVAAWFALQHGSVRYLASRAAPESNASILWRVERARQNVGLSRPVRVLRGGVTDMPMTWGFLRAVLLLPEGMPEWPQARQRDVLLHELAHIKRYDHWTQLLAQIACVMHWFNPLVWYASRRMMLEREHACDDFVLNTGARPSDYAQHLLDVARSMRARRVGAAAAIAMAGRSTLPSRLRAVLEPRRSRRSLGLSATALALVLGAAFVLPLAAVDLKREPVRVLVVSPDARAVAVAPAVHARALPAVWQVAPVVRVPVISATASPVDVAAPVAPQPSVSPSAVVVPHPPVEMTGREAFDARFGADIQVAPDVVVLAPLDSSDEGAVFMAPESGVVLAPKSGMVAATNGASIITGTGVSASTSVSVSTSEGVSTAIVVGDGGSVTEVSVEKGRWNFTWHEGDEQLRIRARGEIQLNDDLTDVVSLSHRGYIDMEEKRGGDRRRVKLNGERDGSIERQWWVDGKEQPYDDEARAWLAETLPEFTRRAGFAVDQRVASLLSRDGVEAVLEEIEQVDSDHVVRLYFSELTAQADLDPEQLERVLRHAGETISSDFELAQLLIGALEESKLRPEGTLIYARATSTIGSDFEQSRALLALVRNYDLDEATLEECLNAALDIGSDFELARLLLEIAREQNLTPPLHRPFFECMRTIGSDYEHRRVLNEFMERDDLSTELLADALQTAARSIGSDYELAELLVKLAKRRDMQPEWIPAYMEALETIGSDYEFRRVAQLLVTENHLDDASLIRVLELAERQLGSDFEMAQFLVEVARNYDLTEDTREAYLRASDTIGSNHENRRVLSELVKRER